MRDQIDLLATVTVLGVLEQAYFAMQVIYARRKYKISPPETSGHPEFERTFRAQYWVFLITGEAQGPFPTEQQWFSPGLLVALMANCSEYFPIFIFLLWVAGIFFHQGVTAVCGLLYLYSRLKYFQGYTVAAQGRLGPLYASAWLLWLLVGMALAGLLAHFLWPSSSTWMAALVWPLQLHGAW